MIRLLLLLGLLWLFIVSWALDFLNLLMEMPLRWSLMNERFPMRGRNWFRSSTKGNLSRHTYQADFVCFGDLIVEMKTVETIADVHRAQLIHYLKATKIKKGLLINFKNKSLQYERFANDY